MTDDKTKKYFLGQLGEIESKTLEEELASSAELSEFAQMIESELVEDYLQGRLSQMQKTSFEDNYLITESRRQKVKLTQVFLKNIQEKPQNIIQLKPKLSIWEIFLGYYQIKIAFAFVFLVGVLFIVFVLFRSKSQKEREISQQQNSNQTETNNISNNSNVIEQKSEFNQNLKQTNIPNNSTDKNEPKPKIVPRPTPKPGELIKPIFANFTLLPGTLRGSEERVVKIPFKTDKITFRLTLPEGVAKYDKYSITVKTSNNETILTTENLKSPNLTISADKLKKDTYIIFLKGNNSSKTAESIAEYTFRVSR